MPDDTAFPDFARAPNIANNHEIYERENAAIDPEGVLWQALRAQADWHGRTLLDLGCGSGFWLPRYAAGGGAAARVIGVEPDPALCELAERRVDGTAGVEVAAGSAEHLPLPDASVDVVHARFAYFFPPGCEPGLTEALRVLRPGGSLVMIDNDRERGEFADLLAASSWAAPQGTGPTTDAWWRERGAHRTNVSSSWRCQNAAELESVLRIEFPADIVDTWLREHPARAELTYSYALFTVAKG